MDQQFGKVLQELRSVKRQVKKLEERGIQKPSVRGSLKAIRAEQHMGAGKPSQHKVRAAVR